MARPQPTCVDLFSGCGGFGLGAELPGFDVIAAVDIDRDLQSGYRTNFPGTQAFQADVSEIDGAGWEFLIGRRAARLDLLIGGPPCQGFSRMGKHRADDPRNTLIAHFFRHVQLLRPRMFVMENVQGLMDKSKVGFLLNAIAELPQWYRIVGPLVVNAADLGAPTNRKRVIVIGYDSRDVDAIQTPDIEVLQTDAKVTVREAIGDRPAPIADTKLTLDFGWANYPTRTGTLSSYAQRSRSLPDRLISNASQVRTIRDEVLQGLLHILGS